jgi:4-amino-4-deoxy-L-arabinose transferase-like glycosyltransferase
MSWYLHGVRPWLWLILLCAALYGPGLAALPATDRDESRFMQASRQMLESGDLVRIRYMHEARNKKPAGIHWLQSASVAAFSDAASTERWPYRLPSALGALAAVLLLFAAGQALFDRKTAFLSAALLAASFILVFEAHIAKTDAVLLATVLAAQLGLLLFFRGARGGKPAPRWAHYLLWSALGLGLLIKGPITPLVTLLTALTLRFSGQWRSLWRDIRWAEGLPLTLVIALPWFIAIMFADPEFMRGSAGQDFFQKLISGQETHGAPPGYYLLLSLVTFAPGSLFIVPAMIFAWRRRREPEIAFCLAWLVPFWLVLEIVPTKLPHYILPAYPALALLIARAAQGVDEGLIKRLGIWPLRLAYVLWAAMIVVFAIGAVVLVESIGAGAGRLLLLPLVAAGITAAVVLRAWRARIFAALLLAAFLAPLLYAPVYALALPRADGIWTSRSAAAAVARAYPDAASRPPLIASGYREPSLVFLLGTSTQFAEPEALARVLQSRESWLALVGADKRALFEAEAAKRGLALRPVESLRGFNYAAGRWVDLTLFRHGDRLR